MKNDSLTVLHISDMQFGRNHRFGQLGNGDDLGINFDTLFQRLSEDITVLENDGLKVQIVVVSGDLAEWGMKSEFDDALRFLNKLHERVGVERERVVIIPGNHDINRKLCEGYFATCEGEGLSPSPPYWPKWKHFCALTQAFYAESKTVAFTEESPWTLYRFDELRTVVAALNSTLVESHVDGTHYGFVGEPQLRWFEDKLRSYKERGWFRLGVVHHNLVRGATNDEENLVDVDDLKRVLSPYLNSILHGHTHKDGLDWLDNNIPIISTGSAALKANARPEEVGNQYQVITFRRNEFERWTRRYDPVHKRWIGDTRCSPNGDVWRVTKPVNFSAVDNAFALAPTVVSSDNEVQAFAQEVVTVAQVDNPISPDRARQQLRGLPRFRLRPEDQHRAVRRQEQDRLIAILQERNSLWLIADWGAGKEGFLASALERMGGPAALADVYRLQCGSANNTDELLREAETQLGLSFQEFFALVATVPSVVLVFDDLPHTILSGSERDNFERKLRPVFDFCPELKVIFTARQEPRLSEQDEVVFLGPLDVPEAREYLRFHVNAQPGLHDAHELEHIQTWSGGLPMHLDRLLERLKYLPLSSILDEDTTSVGNDHNEPLPESLRQAVQHLADAKTKHSLQSFRLLKVLTVLRDGETFNSINRFYRKAPFYQANIDELVGSALIEDIPILQTATDLVSASRLRNVFNSTTPKLLRVPRQVRDLVSSIISEAERDEIILNSTGMFFGSNWMQGRIRMRTTLTNAYGQSAIVGPGNEHVVARHLLKTALDKGNKIQTERYARLATAYCYKILGADRFRDALIAAGSIMELLRDTPLDVQFVDAAYVYGQTLRMTGRESEAVDVLQAALERGTSFITKDFQSKIQLVIAMSLYDMKRNPEAREAAQKTLNLAKPYSSESYQAKAIVATIDLTGAKRKLKLIELEQDARNRQLYNTANNISLDLARQVKNTQESLHLLERVFQSANDPYNRARAIVHKVSILRSHLRISDLDERDRKLLDAAYSYCYAQRISNLLDLCHSVLWDLFSREQMWAAVLRLFRFSSFIWRIRGTGDQEIKYLSELDAIDLQEIRNIEGRTLNNEILYLERRRSDQNSKASP